MKKVFSSLLIITSILCSSVSLAQELRRIEVQGTGQVIATPDVFHVSLSVSEKGALIPKLSDVVDSKVAGIVNFLLNSDIKESELKASVIDLQPVYNNRTVNTDEQLFQLRRQVEFTIHDFEKYALLLHGVIERGATSINSFSAGLSNYEALYRQALNLALKDAVYQAQEIANQLNVTLDKVLLVQEGATQYASPYRARTLAAEGNSGYQAGSTVVSANIHLIYSISE